MAGPSGGVLEHLEADALDVEAFQARLDTLLRS
jgi:hypothetical protein